VVLILFHWFKPSHKNEIMSHLLILNRPENLTILNNCTSWGMTFLMVKKNVEKKVVFWGAGEEKNLVKNNLTNKKLFNFV
jgi:hypothetical protein